MADIVESEEIDKDTVEANVLDSLFSTKYKLLCEQAVSLNKSYINKISGTKSLKLAVGLSDNSIEVYEVSNTALNRICRLSGHQKGLGEVVFSPKEDHMLYSTGHDGVIKLWDTRASGTCAQEYKDEEESLSRAYECMDVSCNGRVVCAGSQLAEDEAYLVFWDQRTPAPLGGYWNSHTDDITQVKFHDEKIELLASGSLDSLINVFNIMELNEDDALVYSLNVENSVEKLTWLDGEQLACITQSNDLQIWDTSSGDMAKSYTRDKLAKGIKRSKPDDCYLVDTFLTSDKTPVLLAGSYAGNGDLLRSVSITDKKLQPCTNFTENKQTVRCCWYFNDHDLLVTAGEAGLLSLWSARDNALSAHTARSAHSAHSAHNKSNVKKTHSKRHKPY